MNLGCTASKSYDTSKHVLCRLGQHVKTRLCADWGNTSKHVHMRIRVKIDKKTGQLWIIENNLFSWPTATRINYFLIIHSDQLFILYIKGLIIQSLMTSVQYL